MTENILVIEFYTKFILAIVVIPKILQLYIQVTLIFEQLQTEKYSSTKHTRRKHYDSTSK